jgi:FixJ family two-component response regulator
MVETVFMGKALTRVALVDDDASFRKALGRLLAASSFEITTFVSATEFLKSLEGEQSPQCLVVDFHMPELTGLDLHRRLAEVGINIPTIVITAHSTPGLRERCEGAGAAAFLEKPFDGSALIGKINSAIHYG